MNGDSGHIGIINSAWSVGSKYLSVGMGTPHVKLQYHLSYGEEGTPNSGGYAYDPFPLTILSSWINIF